MKNILIIRIFTRKIRRINEYKLRLIKKSRGEDLERTRRNNRGREGEEEGEGEGEGERDGGRINLTTLL